MVCNAWYSDIFYDRAAMLLGVLVAFGCLVGCLLLTWQFAEWAGLSVYSSIYLLVMPVPMLFAGWCLYRFVPFARLRIPCEQD